MFDKLWKIVVGSLVLSGLVALVVWGLSDNERQMTKLMQQLAVEVQQEFKASLPRERSINRMLILVPQRSPRSEEKQFRDQLVDTVVASDKYSLVTWAEVEDKVQGSQWTKILSEIGLMPGAEPSSLEQTQKAMKQLDRANFEIDGAMFIDVTEFNEGDDVDGFGARIGVKATIWSRKQGRALHEVGPVRQAIDSRLDLRYLSHAMSKQSLLWRIPLWLILACGLPWALIAVVRVVVKRRDNSLNMALLLAFTVADVVLAWVFLTGFGTGGLAIFGLLLVAGLMGYYNYDATDYIERRLL